MILSKKASSSKHLNCLSEKLPRKEVSAFRRLKAQWRSTFIFSAELSEGLKSSGEAITPKAWRSEAQRLTVEKDADYLKMRAMREDIKAVETLRKTAERLAREGQTQRKEGQER